MSTPRNRQIARMVKEMGLIEKYGTGIKRVRKMFIDFELHEPRFEIIPGGFAVTIFSETEHITKDFIESVNEPVNEPVNDRQKKIMSLIKENNAISINELSNLCKVGRETIKRDLNKLKINNLIKRKGSDKSGFWEVVN